MKFQRISDSAFRCTITSEELSSYDIKLEDLLDNRDKAEKFLRYVLQEAKEELNFTTDTDALSVQLSVMQGGDVTMMISDGHAASLKDVLDELKNTLSEAEGDKKKTAAATGRLLRGREAASAPAEASADIDLDQEPPSDSDIAMAREEEQISASRRDLMEKLDNPLWARFSSLDTAIRAAHKIPADCMIPSELYQYKDAYYLRMSFKGMVDEVSGCIVLLSEFSDTMFPEEESAAHFMEHARCIIRRDALRTLASL